MLLHDAGLSYLHFLFAFILAGALVAELFVLRLTPSPEWVRLLVRIDAFYGLSALGVIAAGLGRVFFGARDAAYYAGEPFFWAKMATFAAIGLLSIAPTMTFFRWRKALASGALPEAADIKKARRAVMIETHLLALIPLFAALMARNIG